MLRSAGFGEVHQVPITIINRSFDPSTFGHGAARLMATFARNRGDLSRRDADLWFESLVDADADGSYFLCSVPVLTAALRLGEPSPPTPAPPHR